MHHTTSSVIAFAATVAAAVQAAALVSSREPADDPASAVAALAQWPALPDSLPGGAPVAWPAPQHGWVASGRVAAAD